MIDLVVPGTMDEILRISQLAATKHAAENRSACRRILGLLILAMCLLGSAARSGADPTGKAAHQSAADNKGISAASSAMFLSSLGVVTHTDQGYKPEPYVAMLRYTGIRNIREGVRHSSASLMLHAETGVLIDLAGADVDELVATARALATAGALLSIEGPNEPNNFPVTYKGKKGGGRSSWIPVAELQRDLYSAVKSDALLRQYPVFHVSEAGAETDNVGLQFLTIPEGAQTLLPDGTQYADYANPHNYVIGTAGTYEDNQAWHAADPLLNSHWDGLYVEYGRTWHRGYEGHPGSQLQTLPRVTTETGWDSVTDPGGERVQGTVLTNTYLAQFKRGWRYTFIYELRDNEGGSGHQGLYHDNATPKLSATYVHNLTSILADQVPIPRPGHLGYIIPDQPPTVHDLLLQKSSGAFELVIWGEKIAGSTDVTVDLGIPYQTISVYDVTVGTSPVQTFTNVRIVTLKVSDHALVIELS